jgi:hypothetical protein
MEIFMKKFLFSLFLLLGISAGLSAAEGCKFNIQVKELRGTSKSFEIKDPAVTVGQLKEMVAKSVGSSAEGLVLFFAGKQLENDKTLADYTIKEGSDLSLVIRTSARPRQRNKAAIGVTLTTLTVAVTGYITKRLYQNKKKRLVRKYKLGNLTNFQDKVWLATKLASYHVPWYLRKIVRDNTGKDLIAFTGKDPHALAELYYGHEPSQEEFDAFIAKFFANIK